MDEPTGQAQAAAQETPPTLEPAALPVVNPVIATETPPPQATTRPPRELSPTEAYEARLKAPKPSATEVAPGAPKADEAPKEPEEAVSKEPEEAAPKEPEKERILPNRISAKQFTPTEQEAIALLREMRQADKDATLKDAYVLVEERRAAATQMPPAQQGVEADPVVQVEVELSNLRDQRRELAKNGSLYETDLDELTIAIEDKIQILAEVKVEQRMRMDREAEAQDAATKAVFEQSKTEAMAAYPALKDPTSELSQAADALVLEFTQPDHPNAAVLQAIDAPMVVAHLAATKLAKESAARGVPFHEAYNGFLAQASPKPAAQRAAPQPPAVTPKKIQPASGAQPATPAQTQLPANWQSMSPDEQYRLRVSQKKAKAGIAIGLR